MLQIGYNTFYRRRYEEIYYPSGIVGYTSHEYAEWRCDRGIDQV